MKAADQHRQNMRVFRMEIVTRPIEVDGHDRPVIEPILAIVAFAECDPGNLGHRIGAARVEGRGLALGRLLNQTTKF